MKLYFVLFATRKNREYTAHAGYIFASDKDRAIELLKENYGDDTIVRSIEEFKIETRAILYGQRWRSVNS